ncbi:hypothetical protein [Acidithrix sp. C25]|nr:hypothetical protein [Acidithrix sp. C25]CAG4926234.1 unnamed protein product [Acidithrix sp. C25]
MTLLDRLLEPTAPSQQRRANSAEPTAPSHSVGVMVSCEAKIWNFGA